MLCLTTAKCFVKLLNRMAKLIILHTLFNGKLMNQTCEMISTISWVELPLVDLYTGRYFLNTSEVIKWLTMKFLKG